MSPGFPSKENGRSITHEIAHILILPHTFCFWGTTMLTDPHLSLLYPLRYPIYSQLVRQAKDKIRTCFASGSEVYGEQSGVNLSLVRCLNCSLPRHFKPIFVNSLGLSHLFSIVKLLIQKFKADILLLKTFLSCAFILKLIEV